MVEVRKEHCPQNHPCPATRYCPFGAIVQNSIYEAPRIIEEKCTDCGKCTRICPVFRMKN